MLPKTKERRGEIQSIITQLNAQRPASSSQLPPFIVAYYTIPYDGVI